MKKISPDIPNKIKQPAQCCKFCGKSYFKIPATKTCIMRYTSFNDLTDTYAYKDCSCGLKFNELLLTLLSLNQIWTQT